MSPKSVLLSAAPAAPSAPQPARSAPAPASNSGADSASGMGPGQPQSAPGAGQSGQPSPEAAPARSANAHSAGGKDTADRKPDTGHKHGAAKTARAKGHSAQSAARPARPDGSFSQTLAKSFATAGRGGASSSDTAPARGSSADKHGAHAPAKESKSDPVASTLALVSQAQPTAPAARDGAGSNKGLRTVATASLLDKSKGAGQGAKGALAHADAQDLKALGTVDGSAASALNTAPVNAAAVLTGAQAGAAAGAPTHAALNAGGALSAPVGTTAWTDQLGARLTWMTHQGIGSASLQLSPKHLGPLQVSISVHHGQASVWFGAAHADTRQALEQAMPQLRQMFSGQGLTLTDSGVSRESPRGRESHQGSAGQVGAIAEESGAGPSGSVAARLGLVDAYA